MGCIDKCILLKVEDMKRAVSSVFATTRLLNAFGWWASELSAIHHALVGLISRRPLETIDLLVSRTGFNLTFTGYKLGDAPNSVTVSAPEEVPREIRRRRKFCRTTPRLVLSLAADARLLRRLRLPAAAKGEIHRILMLELERATPFKVDDVFHGYRICAKSDTSGLVVDHVIVAKGLLAPVLKPIWPCRVRLSRQVRVLTDATPISVELIPDLATLSSERLKMRSWRRAAVTAAAVAALTVPLALHWRQSEALSELSRITQSTRERASDVRSRLSQFDETEKRFSVLHRLRSRSISVAAVWEELTTLLPDGAWLSELRMERNAITLSGFAASSADLLVQLGSSPLFENVRFASPVAKSADDLFERFSIRLDMRSSPRPDLPAADL
jgi:general secretion pathway protein L